ncbi:leucyl aminopeptidase [Candidatus Microgenomates bacterium]|nr:leucyl aminopeptidase [Candidatus Microgenomates bacterium]
MKFTLKPTDPGRIEADVLLIFSWEDSPFEIPQFNVQFNNHIIETAKRENFEGKSGQSITVSTQGVISSYKLVLVGLGKKGDFNLFKLFKTVAEGVKITRTVKPAKIAIHIPHDWMEKFTPEIVVQSMVEAVKLSSYQFLKYKSEEEKRKFREIEDVILSVKAGRIASAQDGLERGLITSSAVIYARDLVNEPAAVTTPTYLSQAALDLAKHSQECIKTKILEKEELEKLGMDAFLGVAKGSDESPKFIHLSFKPKRANKKIVIIGKGLTFDTGGLSLKSSEHMETMKLDMAGAATVLAVFAALRQLKPEVEVVGLIAACENMPSGKALKPGDILRAMNGKTIEVLNTDAEGRLTLADALSFANIKEKPDQIIDLATLTGACIVALGEEIAGLWSNNDELAENIGKAAQGSAEKVWRMPLEEEYKEVIKSKIADLKNSQSGRFGGAINAALFLAEFAASTPWAHLDIAGPAYAEKETAMTAYGGTGFGVRTILSYLCSC